MKRWQDWVNLMLGGWMMVSPWALGFAHDQSLAAVSALVLGAAILVFAAFAATVPKAWEEATNIALGAGLLASPWVLGFEGQSQPTSNAVIVGLLVAAFALWAMLADTTMRNRLRLRMRMGPRH
jgi:hypothetical protein